MTNSPVSNQWKLSFLIGLWLSSCKGPNRIEVSPTSISYIMVYNRGDYSNYDRRRIANRDSISQICRLLNQANYVNQDTLNLKLTSRFARFDLYNTTGEPMSELTYSITGKDGNPIGYHASKFRSDSLDLLLK